jgi:hypothetical protein
MISDRLKQRARLSILEKLKQKGTPGTVPTSAPGPISEEEIDSAAPEETLNDMGLEPSLAERIRLRKKKGQPAESSEATPPTIVTGGY